MNTREQFLHLSQLITGFENLPEKISNEYYNKIMAADGYNDYLPPLLVLAEDCTTEKQLIELIDHNQRSLCKGLIFLWYSAELISWASANSEILDKERIAATEVQYYSSLIWQAIRAHAPALSGGYYGYWKYEPEN